MLSWGEAQVLGQELALLSDELTCPPLLQGPGRGQLATRLRLASLGAWAEDEGRPREALLLLPSHVLNPNGHNSAAPSMTHS